jgi:hypothetical protein
MCFVGVLLLVTACNFVLADRLLKEFGVGDN